MILELMARGGMRIGEVLKLRLGDLQDRKLILRDPKSGKEFEFVFIPQKVADRLREYALQVCNSPNDRIFPISYAGCLCRRVFGRYEPLDLFGVDAIFMFHNASKPGQGGRRKAGRCNLPPTQVFRPFNASIGMDEYAFVSEDAYRVPSQPRSGLKLMSISFKPSLC